MKRSVVAALGFVLASCAGPQRPAPTGEAAAALAYFPPSYDASRAQFRQDCAKSRRSPRDYCGAFTVPSPTDSDLTIDYGFFAGRDGHGAPRRLLIVQSGTHGAEAYAGAAVQQLLLHNYLSAFTGKGVDVLLIHALNPWGFKHDRRTAEDNVNLNRNFSADGSLYGADNAGYEKLRDVIEPQGSIADPSLASLRLQFELLAAALSEGAPAVSSGLDSGQYRHEQGVNFGGDRPEPQTEFLRRVVGGRVLAAHRYGNVLLLDVHTGLGPPGVLSMIEPKHPPARLMAALRESLGGLAGIEIHSAADYYPTEGDVIDFVPGLAADPDTVLAVTMEYGTLGDDTWSELRSAARMILENQAHFTRCPPGGRDCTADDAYAAVRSDFRELFNPSDPGWRAAVLREADAVFARLLDTALSN